MYERTVQLERKVYFSKGKSTIISSGVYASCVHDNVIKCKHLHVTGPLWGNPSVTGGSPHKGQWCAALMFALFCAWTDVWATNLDTGDLKRNRAHYDVIVTIYVYFPNASSTNYTYQSDSDIWPESHVSCITNRRFDQQQNSASNATTHSSSEVVRTLYNSIHSGSTRIH